MNSPVQKIKERLSIQEIVSSYIKLDSAGANFKAKCPFHNEKSPSFFVSPDRGSYYCFGCAAKGDIFTFVEEFEGLDFKGALKLLAEKAGVPLEYYNSEKGSLVFSEKEKLYRVMEESTKFFENNLSQNSQVREYIKNRGIEDKTIKDFRIGFAKDDWRELFNYLKSKNFTDKEIETAGLAKRPDDKNKAPYDRFRGRIMFPISDSSGRVIAFSGRIFIPSHLAGKDDGKSAKYLNSPDTPIFKKSNVLYGIDKAKDSIRKNDFSIVVEGQFDLILSHQAGFKNTVATSGTSLAESDKSDNNTINNLGMISRLSQNIIFIFDSDKAGLAASERATPIGMALFSDMNVKAAQIPDGMDPADLISKKGVDAWREVIRGSKHIIEFLADKYISISNNDILKTKINIEKKIIPYLKLIKNSIKKSHFISLISNKSGIREDDIRDILNKDNENHPERENIILGKENENILRRDHIERRLLGVALWQKTLPKPSIEYEKILEDLAGILEKYKDAKEDLIFEAEVFYGDSDEHKQNLKRDVGEMLSNLEEEKLNEELGKKMQGLRMVKDKESETALLQEINKLNKKKEEIKSGRYKVLEK